MENHTFYYIVKRFVDISLIKGKKHYQRNREIKQNSKFQSQKHDFAIFLGWRQLSSPYLKATQLLQSSAIQITSHLCTISVARRWSISYRTFSVSSNTTSLVITVLFGSLTMGSPFGFLSCLVLLRQMVSRRVCSLSMPLSWRLCA